MYVYININTHTFSQYICYIYLPLIRMLQVHSSHTLQEYENLRYRNFPIRMIYIILFCI